MTQGEDKHVHAKTSHSEINGHQWTGKKKKRKKETKKDCNKNDLEIQSTAQPSYGAEPR